MTCLRPLPRTDLPRPPEARALSGSAHVWWSEADLMQREAATQRFLLDELTPTDRARLSAPRATLPGLATDRPLVMGIVNVTPDSFSDGGVAYAPETALARAQAMAADGADILDIGGESTRPGAVDVPEAEEIKRVVPVIAAIRAEGITTPISIDTRKAAVAQAALSAGANMVNDVSALSHDADLAAVVARAGVPVCLMHAQGDPQTMQRDPHYDNVLLDIHDYLLARMDFALDQGIAPERLIVDPGIGFGKTLRHNLSLLSGLSLFHNLGAAVLLGASRKKFIGTLSGVDPAAARVPGSIAVALQAASQGAQIIRVHDVAETVQALALWRAMTSEGAST
ncbi:MAG: dihydropteroate synthase FolP [Rhodobacteraceae bacterium HLUCCA12]|nr:MAG: dihydropteroate synthase FolP [Rhodobacteraceae bacterium HLUCCA12]